MQNVNTEIKITELNPKQPEFVLATSNYSKKYLMKYNLSHFYQFKAESDKMGVIPDACVDILFWKKAGKLHTKIAGTTLEKGTTAAEIKCEYFGVRFMPGVNPAEGVVKLSELVNHEEVFDEMIPSREKKEQFLETMYFAETFEDKIKAFMDFYSIHTNARAEDKTTLKYAIRNEILKSGGSLKLSDLSTFTGYTERYLNKKIHEDFGMNPKSLIRYIRFQKSVSNLIETIHSANCVNSVNYVGSVNYVDTALELGYFDQSHFIKEFKQFTGLTPRSYIDNLLLNAYDKKLHVVM